MDKNWAHPKARKQALYTLIQKSKLVAPTSGRKTGEDAEVVVIVGHTSEGSSKVISEGSSVGEELRYPRLVRGCMSILSRYQEAPIE